MCSSDRNSFCAVLSIIIYRSNMEQSYQEKLGEGVLMAFSEKKDGPMNFIINGSEEVNFERRGNRAAYLLSKGIKTTQTVVPCLEHKGVVKVVREHNSVFESLKCDAVITDQKNLALTMTNADCPTLFLYDEVKNIIAIVHCGWKPLKEKIVRETIKKMYYVFDCKAEDIKAWISPGICKACYEVGPEVATQFGFETHGTPMKLDLIGQIEGQLMWEGVLKMNIMWSGDCTKHTTKENGDFKYFSYRRDKKNPLDCQMGIIMMI